MEYNYHIIVVRTMKDWEKSCTCGHVLINLHVVAFLSFGISLLGSSRYIIFEMADYIIASEIKFVPTLYLSTSPAEYYD
jgi:hypothetical protein